MRAVIAGIASRFLKTTVHPEDLQLESKTPPPADGWREIFKGLCSVAIALEYASIYVLVDKVDERPFTTKDSKAAFDLVRNLIMDLDLLEQTEVAFKFFLWDQVTGSLKDSGFRGDRITINTLNWSFEELQTMLRLRLSAYSNKRVTSLNQLCAADVSIDLDYLLAGLAQGSPRDMISLGQKIIAQATREQADPGSVSEIHIWKAVRLFSEERAGELFTDVAALRRVKKPTFSMSELASDILRVNENSARRKVQLWQQTGVVAKVGEVIGKKSAGRPQYVYGVSDPRVLIAMLPSTAVEEILGNFVLSCPSCEAFVLDDRLELQCASCGATFALAESRSLLAACQK